ncbi:hypothetical protein HK104_010291 [Borealophlyctis nickersoniae]|nr:hypothetical protein HK104_010291 [Borealophlyctis nickersoniae]
MPDKQYTSPKVAQPRELCDERGLPSKNLTNKVLIKALEKHDEEHGTASEAVSRSVSAELDPVPTPGRTTRSTKDASSNDSTAARATRITRQGSKALDPVTGNTDNSNGVVEDEEKEQAVEEETEVLPPAEGSAKTAGSGAAGKGKRKKNATEDASVVEQEPPSKRTNGTEQDAVDEWVAGEGKAVDPSNEQSMEVDSEPVGQESQISQRQEGEESSVDTPNPIVASVSTLADLALEQRSPKRRLTQVKSFGMVNYIEMEGGVMEGELPGAEERPGRRDKRLTSHSSLVFTQIQNPSTCRILLHHCNILPHFHGNQVRKQMNVSLWDEFIPFPLSSTLMNAFHDEGPLLNPLERNHPNDFLDMFIETDATAPSTGVGNGPIVSPMQPLPQPALSAGKDTNSALDVVLGKDGESESGSSPSSTSSLSKDPPSSVMTAPIQRSAASGPISPSASATTGATSDLQQPISFQWTTEDGSINVWHCTATFVTGAKGKLEGFHPTTPTLLKVLSACPLEVRYGTSTMLSYKGLALALNLWLGGWYVGPDDSEDDARRKPFCMISNTSNKQHRKHLAVFRKDDIRGFVALDDGMRLFVVGAVEGGVFDEVGGKDVGLAVEQFTQAVEVGSIWRAANQTVPPPTMNASAGELLPPAADEHPRPEEKTIEGSEHIPQQDISLEAASIIAQYPKADKRDLEAPATTTTIPVAVYRTSKGVTRADLTIPAVMDTLADLRSAAEASSRGSSALPHELFRNIVKVSHPVVGRNIRCMNKQLSRIITQTDLLWGEAGWRLYQNAGDCWWWAISNRHVEVVRLLLKFGADVHAGDDAALRWASTWGHFALVELLLECGADVHARNDESLTWGGHPDMVELLLNFGANVHAQNEVALRAAMHAGHLKVFHLLLENGANMHVNNDTALVWAACEGHQEEVRLLLENGANVHTDNDRALYQAACRGHLEVVHLLLENGAGVHANNHIAMLDASCRGHVEIVRLLLEKGANGEAKDEALCWAAMGQQVEVVRVLLEFGADGEKPCIGG